MDLVTRLLLETGQFDSNLQKSTSQVRQFQNAGKSFMSAVGGIAGALGLAMGAAEGFKKTIASTQSTEDAFRKMTEQSKAGLDSFFVSLASGGGFAAFISNMDNVIEKAGILDDVLDALGTKSLFSSSELDDLSTQKSLYQSIWKDRTKSDDDRNAALEKTKGIQEKMLLLQKQLADANKKASYATIDAALATQGFTGNVKRSSIDYLLKETNREGITTQGKAYNTKIQGFQTEMNKNISTLYGQPSYSKEYYELERAMIQYQNSKEGQLGKLMATFIEMPDDEASMLKKAIDLKKAANAQYVAISTAELEIANASAKINGSYKIQHGITRKEYLLEEGDEGYNAEEMGASAKKKALIVKGSLDEVNKQIAETRAQYDAAATDQLRTELFKVVSDLEAKKIKLEFVAEHGGSEKGIATPLEMGKIKQAKIEAPDFSGIKPIEITKKDVAVTYDYADGLNAVSNMMGSITNMTRDGASAWISWGATVLGAAASAIPAILAVTAAKKLEAQANITAAGTGAISSAAQTPLIGWLLVGAAAASVIAALASIPKFATGGIVGGSSYTGDKILAGLNSGEMVLNRNQQGNLFRQLNEGGSGGQTVKLRVSGTDLVGVLNNYSSKTKRLR